MASDLNQRLPTLDSGLEPPKPPSTHRRKPRTDQKRQQKKSGKGRKHFRTLLIFIAIVAIIVLIAYILLRILPVFVINEINIEGAQRISAETVSQSVKVEEGTTLISLDAQALSDKVSTNPWIKSVDIIRKFPSTLLLQINENYPTAVAYINPSSPNESLSYYLVAEDGRNMGFISQLAIDAADKLMESAKPNSLSAKNAKSDNSKNKKNAKEASYDAQDINASVCQEAFLSVEELIKIPRITGLTLKKVPLFAEKINHEGLNSALSIISESSEEFYAKIFSIDANNQSSLLIDLNDGLEISFGDANNINDKEAVVMRILAENPGRVAYINVRILQRPAWRALK